jgi:hypothetical protein
MSSISGSYMLHVYRMSQPNDVNEFLRAIQSGLDKGFEEFLLSLEGVESVYPNAIVPISGIIDYLRSKGLEFYFQHVPDYLSRVSFDVPMFVSENLNQLSRSPFDRVWHFHNSEDINNLVDAFVQEVSQISICEPGVLEGISWCLNEVMDNVLQHSKGNQGYIMGQVHRTTRHIALCIFDPGQGIYNSLKDTRYAPRNPVDAITLAIKEGVTRDKKIGQGNGMWGLHNIVKANSGRLAITSNGACYKLMENDIKTYRGLPYLSREEGFTTIDFQIDFDKGISITEALGGHTPVSLRLESFENDRGNILYKLSEKSSGTGTRQSGERLRNEIINLYNETGKVIEIDFSEISVVSSSFADELVGKLVAEFGFAGFNQVFRLKNTNSIVQPIIDRSVFQRLAENFRSEE